MPIRAPRQPAARTKERSSVCGSAGERSLRTWDEWLLLGFCMALVFWAPPVFSLGALLAALIEFGYSMKQALDNRQSNQ
jgi:hypothetical protein